MFSGLPSYHSLSYSNWWPSFSQAIAPTENSLIGWSSLKVLFCCWIYSASGKCFPALYVLLPNVMNLDHILRWMIIVKCFKCFTKLIMGDCFAIFCIENLVTPFFSITVFRKAAGHFSDHIFHLNHSAQLISLFEFHFFWVSSRSGSNESQKIRDTKRICLIFQLDISSGFRCRIRFWVYWFLSIHVFWTNSNHRASPVFEFHFFWVSSAFFQSGFAVSPIRRQFANFQIHLANRLSLFFKAWRPQFDKCLFAYSPIRQNSANRLSLFFKAWRRLFVSGVNSVYVKQNQSTG